MNDSGFPNSRNFCEFTVFISVFNPHKSSVLNHPTPAPSSMPFISNFDFSYPKCHAFGLHCRYYWFRSSCLLDRIFYKVMPKNVWFISKCRDFEIPFLSTFAIPNAPKKRKHALYWTKEEVETTRAVKIKKISNSA